MTEQTLEETKNFQFRNVPGDLHYKWKVISAFEGKSMEEVGLEAIAIHVLKLMEERKGEIKEMAQDLKKDADGELRKEEESEKGE